MDTFLSKDFICPVLKLLTPPPSPRTGMWPQGTGQGTVGPGYFP